MKSPSPDKWQIFGGYTFQRTSGLLNGFGFNATCEGSEYGCDEFSSFNSNGGQFAISYFPRHHLGVTFQGTFEVSGTRDVTYYAEDPPTQSINMQSYLFGPTYRHGIYGGKASLFYQVLAGVTHNTFNASTEDVYFCYSYTTDTYLLSCSTNNFTLATGGGVDFRLNRHIAVRPAQLEYWEEQIPYRDYYPGYPYQYSLKEGIEGLRYSAGAVFNF
jgi:opacity protein-like surface antigen